MICTFNVTDTLMSLFKLYYMLQDGTHTNYNTLDGPERWIHLWYDMKYVIHIHDLCMEMKDMSYIYTKALWKESEARSTTKKKGCACCAQAWSIRLWKNRVHIWVYYFIAK